MEIKDVFGAQPKSVWEYLCENGQGLYVPAYQRQYSWDKPKISRLFEDACHGFTMLIERDDAITFLGTIIAIHDTALVTVAPLVKGDVPSRVMTIIDGQQRLTTLLLTNTVLHEEIRLRSEKLKSAIEPEKIWLHEECMKVIGRLAKTFEENKDYGDGPFQYYPRMIRAYDDSWSRKKDKASYLSPIGHYLHLYGQYGRGEVGKPFKYTAPNSVGDQAKYNFLAEGRKNVQRLIKAIAKNDHRDLELPEFEKIVQSPDFQNILVKAEFPASVIATLSADNNQDYKELVRLVLFANFVLDRVAITIVTAKNEDYAFDMFESLNTTGEPLTAFETFKPRVIHSEKLGDYENSKSHEYITAIEGYLENFTKSADKQDATSRLIVSFALAERGEKLSKRLSDQRRFLRDNYEQIESTDEQREFVRHLSHAALFVQHTWPDERVAPPRIYSVAEAETDEVLLCIDLLRQFNHSITIGPLIRFYSGIRRADAESRIEAVNEFVSAVKAITAFSVIWRSSRRGTENIDTLYRGLMDSGCPEVGMKALARGLDEACSHSADMLRKAFVFLLKEKGGIESKEDWVKLVAKIPAYTNQREISRFLLLAAAHDSSEDKNVAGLTVAGKSGLLPLLNFKSWRDESSQTVEHIAPKERSDGWLDGVYEDPEIIDRLGNLTLLPAAENASVGNGSWSRKRLMYKVLSANTSDELDPLIAQAKAQGIEISQSTTDLLSNSRHLPMVKAIAAVEGDWTAELIELRSARIAELAWARIAPWLNLAT